MTVTDQPPEYITCPYCQSTELDWYDHDWEGTDYIELGECLNCGVHLMRIYVFDTIIKSDY